MFSDYLLIYYNKLVSLNYKYKKIVYLLTKNKNHRCVIKNIHVIFLCLAINPH